MRPSNIKNKNTIRRSYLRYLALTTTCCLSFSAAAISASLEEMMPKAVAGDNFAENTIGEMYMHGDGVHKDYAKAFEWLLKAANHGNPFAPNHLAVLYAKGHGVPENPKKAFDWLKISAERGYYLGQHNLAIAYEEGNGTKPNLIQAYVWSAVANEAAEATDVKPHIKEMLSETLARIKDSLTKEELEEALFLVQKKKKELMQTNGANLLVVPAINEGS